MVQINKRQLKGEYIQLEMSANQTVNSGGAVNVAFNTVDVSNGTRLTYSSNGVLIGAGVSKVKVSYSIFGENSTSQYIYCRIILDGSERSTSISNAPSMFKFVSESKILAVTPGQLIQVRIDSSGASTTINAARQCFLLVEVIE